MLKKSIFVTKPSLPSIDDFIPLLQEIWASGTLTNGGKFHQDLEKQLCSYLGVKNISLFTNGTIALITALKALNIKGEVITTPYSFVATSHALLWNDLKPVFVDIDPKTLNLDPSQVEKAITSSTSAILPVHCYGISCDVDAIDAIAKKHHLKVIYDAAHAFGVNCHCGSVLNHGDLSVLSFHATKVFNTFEGGAIVSHSADMKKTIDQLKNFGFTGETTVESIGINGKMSEISAAFGLLQLQALGTQIQKRKEIDLRYRQFLSGIKGLDCIAAAHHINHNYSYFPILIGAEFPISRDDLYNQLKLKNIFTRRYFYPLISEFSMYQSLPSARSSNLPNATKIAKQILCLPIYSDLNEGEQQYICDLIKAIAFNHT